MIKELTGEQEAAIPAYRDMWIAIGVHRFYVGKTGTGILYLCTLGFLGFGALFDCLVILCGSFTDREDDLITNW